MENDGRDRGEAGLGGTAAASLKQVADQARSLADFGRHMRDWLLGLRRLSSRSELLRAIADEPRVLGERFPQGRIADAWLAAHAEHLASRIGSAPPAWTLGPSRFAEEPWFVGQSGGAGGRAVALVQSPPAFRRRNLFTPDVELTLGLRAGRPRKSAEEKRVSNAGRQRRFRERRRAELMRLRDSFYGRGGSL
jgi:hypothetical protein